MELPKNITQIGESNPHCKVYVEDYAISYIKQLNYTAAEKHQAVGLFGRKTEEEGITYIFLYGACRLHFLQRECRHLSQAVMLEAEKQRKKYFAEQTFLAYCILDGDMLEGFYIYEQGVCRYVEGYAQFYEKNDSMLAFMLADREEEVKPETVKQEKYEEVKKRQEERRAIAERRSPMERKALVEQRGGSGVIYSGRNAVAEKRNDSLGGEGGGQTIGQDTITPISGKAFGRMKWAAAAVFALICVAGLMGMGSGEDLDDIQVAVRQAIEALTEQKLPDDAQMANASAQVGTIVAEDKLTDVLRQENASSQVTEASGWAVTAAPTAQPPVASTAMPAAAHTAEPTSVPTPVPTATPTPIPTAEPTAVPTAQPTAAPVSYTIKEGDTLSAICWRLYGSDARLAEICRMNHIDDPDDIKVGEKILLP